MKKQKTYTILIFFTFIILLLASQSRAGWGATEMSATIVQKDTYVWSANPDTNYGSANELYSGNYSGWMEIYVGFNLTGRPEAWDNVELVFLLGAGGVNINGYFRETDPTWVENDVTWNNRPTLHAYSENVAINTSTDYIRINLTTYIHQYDSSAANTNLSLLLNATPTSDGNYRVLSSKEIAFAVGRPENAPSLVWSTTVPDDYSGLIAAIAGITGIGVVAILTTRYAYHNRKTINWKQVGKRGLGINFLAWLVVTICFIAVQAWRWDLQWYVYFTPLIFIPFGILARNGKKNIKESEKPADIDEELKLGT